jgi:hypothetical protein
MYGIWSLGQKTALFRHFFTFFQLHSPAMRLQKGKKLTKNSSFLSQAPNPKHALSSLKQEVEACQRSVHPSIHMALQLVPLLLKMGFAIP